MKRISRKKYYRTNGGNHVDNAMSRTLDDLAAFEDYKTIWGVVRKEAEYLDEEQIRAKYTALLQAKLVSIALTEKDSLKALAAIKDILDRKEGKAKERQEVTHRLKDVAETEIDSLILTKLRHQNEKNKSQKH